MSGTWSAAANVGYSTYAPFAGGNADNAICASGGSTTSNVTKEFNGTTWSAGGNLPVVVSRCPSGDCGNATAAIATGGWSSDTKAYTFIYNGTSWSTGNNLNTARWGHGSFATSASSALVVGGSYNGVDNLLNSCETYNGTSWSTTQNYYAAIRASTGGGTGASAISFSGYLVGTPYVNTAYSFNGSAWAAISSLSMARYDAGGGGTPTKALCFGGRDASITNSTEEFNSSTWSAGGNLNTARRLVSGGLSASGISISGYTTLTVQTVETYAYPSEGIIRNSASSRNAASNRLQRFNLDVGTPIVLITPTYDGSGQAVHPSVRYFPATFGGYKYWMGMTPYPNTNDDYENPSLLASDDTITWVVPSGITNPLAPMPGHHNADSCLVYDGSTLYYYYLEYTSSTACSIKRITVTEDPLTVGSNVSCTGCDSDHIAAPAIVRNGASDWVMWYVDWGTFDLVRYTSTDGLAWTNRTIVSIFVAGQPILDTLVPWHFTVKKIGDRYLFVCCCYPVGGNNAQTDLYWATADRWDSHLDFRSEALLTEFSDWGTRQVYMSDLCQLENGMWRLFISAATKAGVWRIGYADIALW